MNLTALYQRGASLVAQAIETSGTTVSISRDPDQTGGITVDKATLAITDATEPVPVLTDEPAIVVSAGIDDTPVAPGRILACPVDRILFRPSAAQVRQGDQGTVTASRDPALVGATFTVTSAHPDPSGAFHDVRTVSR